MHPLLGLADKTLQIQPGNDCAAQAAATLDGTGSMESVTPAIARLG